MSPVSYPADDDALHRWPGYHILLALPAAASQRDLQEVLTTLLANLPALALPNADLDWLKRRVSNFAEDRPGIYRMVNPRGEVIYVGKAKRLRTRILSYFRAKYPEDKASRILHAAADIQWTCLSSEFAALLQELREIKKYRPLFNVRMKRDRRTVLIKVTAGAAPKIIVGSRPGTGNVRHYGPFDSAERARLAVKTLNDLLGLRDCAGLTPIKFAEQGDLFDAPQQAACMRYELGTCTAPCAGRVDESEYRRRCGIAVAFLEGRSIAPLDRVIEEMQASSAANEFERASWWRGRFEALEWLLKGVARARQAIDSLSFIYHDPGAYGDDRAYLIRQATVRAVAPSPTTPIEREAFRSLVQAHAGHSRDHGPLPAEHLDEMLLLLRWFKTHPSAMRRTQPFKAWMHETTRPPNHRP